VISKKIFIQTLIGILFSFHISISKEIPLVEISELQYQMFGYAVAISDNYAVVCSIGSSADTQREGVAYFYKKIDNNWIFNEKHSSKNNNDNFGCSVAISGNMVVVGAKYDDDQSPDEGAVYVYKLDEKSGKWIFSQKLYANNASESSLFGYSVSISDNNLIVGAAHERENGIYGGSVYIFEKMGDAWGNCQKISAHDGKQGDLFGSSVSISTNYALVGANNSSDCAGNNSGSVYFYKKQETSYRFLQKVCASDAGHNDQFGCSVSINDQYAVIGADQRNERSGSTYIFKNDDDYWIEIQKLNAFNGKSGDRYGTAVSIDGNLLVIGANHYSTALKSHTGIAYIYKLNNNYWEYYTSIEASDSESLDIFGSSVSVYSGNILISAYGKNNSAGKAYIYSDVLNQLTISGYITNVQNKPIPNARIASSTKQTTISDNAGFFNLNVPYNFCGSLSIFINDYIIPSSVKQYTNVRNDIFSEKYIIDQYSISGFISDTKNNPISGIQIHFSNGGGEAISNINGYFTHEVYKGWTGTINPSGRGYHFTPSYIALDNISNHYSDQLFKGSKLSISGYVIDEIGNPVESVKMALDKPNNINVTTDQYGFYILEIDKDWSGYISPEKDSCTFSPSGISYTSVSINFTNQNFNCILTTPTFEVSSDILNLTSKSGFSYITISSNGLPFNKYSASIDQDSWLNISKLESAVLIIHQENDQYSDRIATLTISAGNQSKTIQLIQKSKTLELDWNVDISRFQFQGNITAIVKDSDGIIIQSDNDILAAFVGDECRGKAFLSPVSDGKRFFLQVWSNKLSETMTFKYFDSNQQLVFDYLKPAIEFSPDIEMGNISSPFELTLMGNNFFPDANDDGSINLKDLIDVLKYLTKSYQ